jgi:tetratricopeptide (TPR) repeat protein
VLILLVLSATGAGLYGYALYQWQAAQAAVKADRMDEAQQRLDFCLTLWPRSIPVHLLAARVARLRGDFEGAEAHLNRCLKLNHGATEAIQLEFLLLRVQGGEEDEVAGDLFSLYVDQNSPESALILETLARAYMQNHRYGPAYACLSRWAEVAPDSAEPPRWRGWILEHLGDREEAIKEYKRALELDPDLVPVRLRLTEVYLERSDPLAALPHLERLHKQFPDRPDIMARLGQCRFLQGETQAARRLLEAAIEQLPQDSAVLIHLAKVEMQEDHPAKAEAWLRRALELDPADTEAEFRLAAALRAQNRSDEARAMLERYEKDRAMWIRVAQNLRQDVDSSNLDAAALTEIGVLFLRTDERLGRYWLHRALKRDPGYQPAHQALAEHHDRKGELEKADLHRRQLKPEPNPANPSPLRGKSEIRNPKSERNPKPESESPKANSKQN